MASITAGTEDREEDSEAFASAETRYSLPPMHDFRLCVACGCVALDGCLFCSLPYCTDACMKLDWDERGHRARCQESTVAPPYPALGGALPNDSVFALGDAAVLFGLTKAPELNGELVTIRGYSALEERFKVATKGGRFVKVRLENLRTSTDDDVARTGRDAVTAAAEALAVNCLSAPFANSISPVEEAVLSDRISLLGELRGVAASTVVPEALRRAQAVLIFALLESWRTACKEVMDNREGIKADLLYGHCDDFYSIRGRKIYNCAQRRPEMDTLESALVCCGVPEEKLPSLLGMRSLRDVPRALYPLPWDGVLEQNADGRTCYDAGLPDASGRSPPRRGWVTDASGCEAHKYLGGGNYMVGVSHTNQRGGRDEYY